MAPILKKRVEQGEQGQRDQDHPARARALKTRPLLSLTAVSEKSALSFPAASSAMDLLVELGIARELTGKRRNRLFVYSDYLGLLEEGTGAA